MLLPCPGPAGPCSRSAAAASCTCRCRLLLLQTSDPVTEPEPETIIEIQAAATEVVGVDIACVSLIFQVTEWLRWQGEIPFAFFQDGIPSGSSPEHLEPWIMLYSLHWCYIALTLL